MKSKNFSKIIKALNSKGFKNVELDPVIETKYIRGVNLKKYLFTFNDDKGVSFSLRPDLSLMSLIQFSKTKNYNIHEINTFFFISSTCLISILDILRAFSFQSTLTMLMYITS